MFFLESYTLWFASTSVIFFEYAMIKKRIQRMFFLRRTGSILNDDKKLEADSVL